MKKFLLIPTIAALAAAPISIVTSCTVHLKPTPPGPTPEEKFEFSFTGTNCTINGKENYSDEIAQGKENVQFTVVPEPNFVFIAPDFPEGVTYEEKNGVMVVTISCMNKNYSISVTAEEQKINDFLTFTATADCEFYVNHYEYGMTGDTNLHYSIDGGDWEEYNMSTTPAIQLESGQIIQFYGDNTDGFSYNDVSAGECSVYGLVFDNDDQSKPCGKLSGNVMSLISKEDFESITQIPCIGCFYELFAGSNISSASNLVLPCDQLEPYCYEAMFANNEYLIYSPILPASELEEDCYFGMFEGCKNLTYAPDLPAETLADGCYVRMFDGCSNLTSAPDLPAETLADYCYAGMFINCQSLTSAPDLPAQELTRGCYQYMFVNCSSLIYAPELEITQLDVYCCAGMFMSCYNLISAPELPSTDLFDGCYYEMFAGCNSLHVSQSNSNEINYIFTCPDTTEFEGAVDDMFANTGGSFRGTPITGYSYYWYTGERLQQLTFTADEDCMFGVFYDGEPEIEDVPNLQYSINGGDWIDYTIDEYPEPVYIEAGQKVRFRGDNPYGFNYSSGDFVCSFVFLCQDFSYLPCGKISGNVMSLISPDNFESITEIPCDECFAGLFSSPIGRNGISDASDLVLPCNQLTTGCYEYMFYNNTNLVSPPRLPAMELADYCYYEMFYGCESLTSAPQLLAEYLAIDCYQYMFYNCANLKIMQVESGANDEGFIFTCSDSDDCEDMFSNTGGMFTGDPADGWSYYWYDNEYKYEPLTFTADTDCMFGVMQNTIFGTAAAPNLEYSINGGDWEEYEITSTPQPIIVGAGQKVRFRGDNPNGFSQMDAEEGIFTQCSFLFAEDDLINRGCGEISGNVMSLISKDNYINLTEIPCDGCFNSLFGSTEIPSEYPNGISNANHLILPSMELKPYCYSNMFHNCKNLITAPQLPAEDLDVCCYLQMFSNCTGLIQSPELPAEQLSDGCYAGMFSDCASLIYAPELPAEHLTNGCYREMFAGCKSLVISEEVPNDDKHSVFTCPDTSGVMNAVDDMFSDISEESQFTSGTPTAYNSYYYHTQAFSQPLTFTASKSCSFSIYHEEGEEVEWQTPNLYYSKNGGGWTEYEMPNDSGEYGEEIFLEEGETIQFCGENPYGFSYCNSPDLNYASTYNMNFYSDDNEPCGEISGNIMSLLSFDFENKLYIPSDGCFIGLFEENGISSASDLVLPAMSLTSYCYLYMFGGCENLISPPKSLPARNLNLYCYTEMFGSCTSLTSAPKIAQTSNVDLCCFELMFWNCSSLKIEEVPPNGDEDKLIFTCPDFEFIMAIASSMFMDTQCTFSGTPTPGYSYYWY